MAVQLKAALNFKAFNFNFYSTGAVPEVGDISSIDRLAGGDKSDSGSDSDVPKHILDVSSV